MDDTLKDDELELDDLDPKAIPPVIAVLGDEEEVETGAISDTVSIDDLADAEEEEEEGMYEEDEM